MQLQYLQYSNFEVDPKLIVSFMPDFTEQTLVETLLEIRNSLIE